MADKKERTIPEKVCLWLFVYWWFYPLKWLLTPFYWLFVALPRKQREKKYWAEEHDYIVNLNSLLVHKAECAHVRTKEIDFEKKYAQLHCKFDEIHRLGYQPCNSCKPDQFRKKRK
ncbi:MAG: hypothetical protein IK130_12250 [Oscillospiraceae bacterium]|nr:hypothetical protein [Oscillospiraceae bacterium]